MTYDFLAGFLIGFLGLALIVFYATERYDDRPVDDEDQEPVGDGSTIGRWPQ